MKVYLETTIFKRLLEPGINYHADTVVLFAEIEIGKIKIVSLNFHHINKLKTKIATEVINRDRGYSNPYICTPVEVISNE